MKYFLLFIILFNFSCIKQKSVLICGDHKCINKAEAKQFFEDNLTIEVQIISKEKKSSYDLVDLNISGEEPNIKVFKNESKKVVRKLSKEEIKAKKDEIKKKKSESSIKPKKAQLYKKKSSSNEKKVVKNRDIKKKNTNQIISSLNKNKSIDICLKLEKCDIDSITDYLIKTSNEKDFPNIALKD